MSLNESIEIVREALKNEIPSDKEFLALHEVVSLAHIKIINAEIDKIKSDNKKSIKALVDSHLSLSPSPRKEKVSSENINFITHMLGYQFPGDFYFSWIPGIED